MKHKLFYTCLLLSMFGLGSCNSDNNITDEPEQENVDTTFVEAQKWDSPVTAEVYSTDSRATSTSLSQNIEEFTATSLDAWTDYQLVTYHGRHKSNIGMVQLYKKGTLVSEIVFKDARVNFAHLYKGEKGQYAAYIGIDQNFKRTTYCGIFAVKINNDKFESDADGKLEVVPYRVEGLSINCIKQQNDTQNENTNIMVVVSGGNDTLDDIADAEGDSKLGEAGFTKFLINKSNPSELQLLAQDIKYNYRGYWFSYGKKDDFTPIAYTYRKVDKGDLTFNLGVIKHKYSKDLFDSNEAKWDKFIFNTPDDQKVEREIFRLPNTTESFGRYNTSVVLREIGTQKEKFILATTGVINKSRDIDATVKSGGIFVYYYGNNQLRLVDNWVKQSNVISSIYKENGKEYVFIGCGDGVYKVRMEYTADNKSAKLVPEKKFKTSSLPNGGLTESGTLASVNYIQVVENKKVHVAYGYAGYLVLDPVKDFTVDCEKRTDMSDAAYLE